MTTLTQRGQRDSSGRGSLITKLHQKRWLIMSLLVFGWLLGTALGRLLPPKYRSETVIMIEQQKVPDYLVEPNISMSAQQQKLQSTTKQILSRTRLLALIDKFNLYQSNGEARDLDALAEQMRKNIKIDLMETPGMHGQLDAFQVSFSAPDPYLAQKVTTEIASQFINENVQGRRQISEDTTSFLKNELEKARQSLSEQEEKLRVFRTQSFGELPEQLQSNLEIFAGLQKQLQDANDALSRDQQHSIYLKSLYRQYQVTGAISNPSTSSGYAGDPQLATLKAQLAELERRYTDRYPEVVRLKQQIAELEARTPTNPATGTAVNSKEIVASMDVREGSPTMQLSNDLSASEIQIASEKAKIANLENQVKGYQSRLNSTPDRQEQAATVMRDYDQSRTYYESLLSKMMQSEMATELEKERQDDQFRVIDSANLPNRPYFPNRLVFSLAGLVAGAALGLVISFLSGRMNSRLYEEEELMDYIGSSFILTLPLIFTEREVRAARRRLALERIAAAILIILIPAATLLNYLKA
jgi:polysaccharide chain length determinant protein (PEP-CTERM system associated)